MIVKLLIGNFTVLLMSVVLAKRAALTGNFAKMFAFVRAVQAASLSNFLLMILAIIYAFCGAL